jgi:hypothetical protein
MIITKGYRSSKHFCPEHTRKSKHNKHHGVVPTENDFADSVSSADEAGLAPFRSESCLSQKKGRRLTESIISFVKESTDFERLSAWSWNDLSLSPKGLYALKHSISINAMNSRNHVAYCSRFSSIAVGFGGRSAGISTSSLTRLKKSINNTKNRS